MGFETTYNVRLKKPKKVELTAPMKEYEGYRSAANQWRRNAMGVMKKRYRTDREKREAVRMYEEGASVAQVYGAFRLRGHDDLRTWVARFGTGKRELPPTVIRYLPEWQELIAPHVPEDEREAYFAKAHKGSKGPRKRRASVERVIRQERAAAAGLPEQVAGPVRLNGNGHRNAQVIEIALPLGDSTVKLTRNGESILTVTV